MSDYDIYNTPETTNSENKIKPKIETDKEDIIEPLKDAKGTIIGKIVNGKIIFDDNDLKDLNLDLEA